MTAQLTTVKGIPVKIIDTNNGNPKYPITVFIPSEERTVTCTIEGKVVKGVSTVDDLASPPLIYKKNLVSLVVNLFNGGILK